MGVTHAGAEEEVEDARQHGVADVAVVPRHRPGLDVLHPVPHHELGACVELLHKPRDVGEVIGQVRVGHDDVLALGCGESGEVGAAVTAPLFVDDPRAGLLGQLRAAVGRAVVGDDDLALVAVLAERLPCAPSCFDRLRLVQAGDHDRDEGGSPCLGFAGPVGDGSLDGGGGRIASHATLHDANMLLALCKPRP